MDSFTDTNGVLLTAHTPELDTVGSGWVIDSGGFDIQSNAAHQTSGVATIDRAIIDSGEIDKIVILNGRTGYFDNADNIIDTLIFRFQDSINYWYVQIKSGSSGVINIYEVNGGVSTNRGSTAVTSLNADNVAYRAVVIDEGDSIYASIRTPSQFVLVSYLSASFLNTNTKVGFFKYRIGALSNIYGFESFMVFPRGTNGEYNELENY